MLRVFFGYKNETAADLAITPLCFQRNLTRPEHIIPTSKRNQELAHPKHPPYGYAYLEEYPSSGISDYGEYYTFHGPCT